MIVVTAIGKLIIDFAAKSADEDGYPTMAAHPGGAPGNFLAALSAFGAKTAFLGKVGDDDFGKRLIGTLKKHGMETNGVVADPDSGAHLKISMKMKKAPLFDKKSEQATCH